MEEAKIPQAKREIREMNIRLIATVQVAKLMLNSAEPGMGDLMIDVLIEDLQKMKTKQETPKPSADTDIPATERYIGTKLIQAEPAWRITDPSGHRYVQTKKANASVQGGSNIEDGYRVVYEDGYESWSPKDVFEAAYRRCNDLNFGLAIEATKKGQKIARRGWNGRNQYVELATNVSYKSCSNEVVNADHSAIGNAALAFVGTSGVQLGWLASQADMLADDWYIVEQTPSFKVDVAASEHACNCAGWAKEECVNE